MLGRTGHSLICVVHAGSLVYNWSHSVAKNHKIPLRMQHQSSPFAIKNHRILGQGRLPTGKGDLPILYSSMAPPSPDCQTDFFLDEALGFVKT